MKADGYIHPIQKGWPILTPASVAGARLALAAKDQGCCAQIHDTLMAISRHRASEGATARPSRLTPPARRAFSPHAASPGQGRPPPAAIGP